MEELEKKNQRLQDEMHLLRTRIKEFESTRILQKKEKNKHAQNERYYRSIINHIHEDILVIDKNYKITDVNKTFLLTCGRKREDVIGHYCYEISHGFDKPCEEHGEDCPLLKVFATGQIHTACHQHLHSGGWKTWVDLLLSPLTDDNGNITHVIKAIRDVSELVNAGKSLEEINKKYRRVLASSKN
ncbi:MAG: PAS domain-containing protein [Desulfobacula sp.]|nr:PAS domain-containing protein [Desulfobacula sp.]